MKAQTLLFITDISGYTKYIAGAGHEEGLRRAQDMLKIILQANTLKLQLCEIEGDAIFFYANGRNLPTATSLLHQIRKTYDAFYRYLSAHGLEHELGLKFFIHTGLCEEMPIGGRTKLFGLDVIKIHRLMKTVQDRIDYVLITEEAAAQLSLQLSHHDRGVAEFPHLGSIEYVVYDAHALVQEQEKPARIRAFTSILFDAIRTAQIEINRQIRTYSSLLYPLQRVV